MSANFAGDSKKSDEVDHSTLQVVVADPLTSGFNNGNDGTSMEKSSKWVKFEEDDEDKFKNVSLHDDSRINKVRECLALIINICIQWSFIVQILCNSVKKIYSMTMKTKVSLSVFSTDQVLMNFIKLRTIFCYN